MYKTKIQLFLYGMFLYRIIYIIGYLYCTFLEDRIVAIIKTYRATFCGARYCRRCQVEIHAHPNWEWPYCHDCITEVHNCAKCGKPNALNEKSSLCTSCFIEGIKIIAKEKEKEESEI